MFPYTAAEMTYILDLLQFQFSEASSALEEKDHGSSVVFPGLPSTLKSMIHKYVAS